MKPRSYFIVFALLAVQVTAKEQMCRHKFGLRAPEEFRLFSCAWCYFFLFQTTNHLVPSVRHHYLKARINGTSFSQGDYLLPDIRNSTSRSSVCESLSDDECDRWVLCCSQAEECCDKQVSAAPYVNNTCPRTWDGYGCWEDTRSGTTTYISCPVFLEKSVPTRNAIKKCQSDGTWYKRNRSEWTDYTPCLDKESLISSIFLSLGCNVVSIVFLVPVSLISSIYLSLGCNVVSIVFLVPAVSIFLIYRSLRRQHRIRLHMNFFLSFIVSDVMTILWDMLVTYDRLTNEHFSKTVLYQNGAGCKFLSFLRIYSKSTNYVWMFCEGFYLHRLISNAFKPPKNLLPLYLTGWGIPLIYCMIYGIIRLVNKSESCWAKSLGNVEWIIYTPNLLCLVVNLFFLCNILRILLTQLQSHPNEPNNFRRALKATFVLIPLFGVQLFVTLYRIPTGTPGASEYEKFTVFVINSQGFFVAMIFCFCNSEVLSLLRRTFTRLKIIRSRMDLPRGTTTATSLNFTHAGKEDSHETENGTYVFNESPGSSPSPNRDRIKMDTYDKQYFYTSVSPQLSTKYMSNSKV